MASVMAVGLVGTMVVRVMVIVVVGATTGSALCLALLWLVA